MNATTYSLVSVFMKYWFLLLIALILYYLIRNAMQEYLFTRKSVAQGVVHMYWLKMVESEDRSIIGNMVGLRHTNIVGCTKACDIYLPFAGVSKQHCLIKYKGDKFVISDHKSHYGTFVNGVEIKRNQPLKNGDVITLGSCSIMFVVERGNN